MTCRLAARRQLRHSAPDNRDVKGSQPLGAAVSSHPLHRPLTGVSKNCRRPCSSSISWTVTAVTASARLAYSAALREMSSAVAVAAVGSCPAPGSTMRGSVGHDVDGAAADIHHHDIRGDPGVVRAPTRAAAASEIGPRHRYTQRARQARRLRPAVLASPPMFAITRLSTATDRAA